MLSICDGHALCCAGELDFQTMTAGVSGWPFEQGPWEQLGSVRVPKPATQEAP
jgi:hypothetical protein